MSRVRDIANILSGGSSAIATDAEIPSFVAGKNFVINGGFDVWQRGTTISNAAHNTYTADQWININDSVGVTNVTRQDISSQGIGSRYAARYEKSAGASNRFVFITLPEGALSCVGKQVTFSFWIRKGPNLTSGIVASIGTRANKYGAAYDTGDFSISNSQINTTTFTKFTSTFNVTSATANASADLFEIEFSAVQAGSTGVYFEIAGVQLEVGSVATPFSRAGGTVQGELTNCQRYYWRTNTNDSTAYGVFGFGYSYATNLGLILVNFPVTMRSLPAFFDYQLHGYINYNNAGRSLTSIAVNQSTRSSCWLQYNITGGVQGEPAFVQMNNGSGYLGFSAEL